MKLTKSIDNLIGVICLIYGINIGFSTIYYGIAIFGIMSIISGVFFLACHPIHYFSEEIKKYFNKNKSDN